jgi:hypothetical protein
VVEIEVRKADEENEKGTRTTLDINEIINKISEVTSKIKELSGDGKPMSVRLDGFNFSIARAPNMYDLTMKLNLTVKPKTPPTKVEVTVKPAPAT